MFTIIEKIFSIIIMGMTIYKLYLEIKKDKAEEKKEKRFRRRKRFKK